MPTRKPGFDDGNRLVTRFGNVDDMDNDASYRLGDGDVAGFGTEDNKNKKRFPASGPVYVLNINDLTQDTTGQDPPMGGSMVAGYELQNNGNAWRYEDFDSNDGMPDVTLHFNVTDWVDNKLVAGVASSELIYARFSQSGGSGPLGFGSSAPNTWRLLSGPAPQGLLILLVSPFGTAFADWQGTVEISRDQVIIEDTCSISLSCTQTGP